MKKIGIYLRLSDEDGTVSESNSIKGQRALIYDYISKNDAFLFYETVEFCDDGYSGTNFDRPAVTQMLLEAQRHEIECVIVKDFSRFGRNYIEVGRYLEYFFPIWGTRFVSVNDGFDSKIAMFHQGFLSMSFQNLMHDFYSKDLSEKITSVRHAKAKQGEMIAAFAPYGYRKSKEKKLLIDKEAALVVEWIFDMAQRGISKVEIAHTLNEEKIPSPCMLRKSRNENFACHLVGEKMLWYPSTISKILKDQRYVGDGVYGKEKPVSVGSRKSKKVSKEDWIIVPDTHEAIIKREIFEMVNATFKTYETRKVEKHPFSKKIRCGMCNYIISRKVSGNRDKNNKIATYRCSSFMLRGKADCYKEQVMETELEDLILYYINGIVGFLYYEEMQSYFSQRLDRDMEQTENLIKQQEKELKKIELLKVRLYEKYRENKIARDVFIKKKLEQNKKCQSIERILFLEYEKLNGFNCDLKMKAGDLQHSFELFQKITRQMVEIFLDKIIIEQNGVVRVFWNFQTIYEQ